MNKHQFNHQFNRNKLNSDDLKHTKPISETTQKNHQACLDSTPNSKDYSTECATFITWQKRCLFLCKRGNLETELLLQSYIHSLKPPLAVEKKELIDDLLQQSEQDLFHWLLLTQTSNIKPVRPLPNAYLELIHQIRDNYLNSNK